MALSHPCCILFCSFSRGGHWQQKTAQADASSTAVYLNSICTWERHQNNPNKKAQLHACCSACDKNRGKKTHRGRNKRNLFCSRCGADNVTEKDYLQDKAAAMAFERRWTWTRKTCRPYAHRLRFTPLAPKATLLLCTVIAGCSSSACTPTHSAQCICPF